MLVLENASKLAADTSSKNPIVFEDFLEKVLKFRLHYWILNFEATFMLVPLLDYQSTKKKDNKKDLVKPISHSNITIVFTLLVKAITVEIGVFIIKVR